eukprot:scaffold23312_cov67-Phaeocystis_antarctica.AAC.8
MRTGRRSRLAGVSETIRTASNRTRHLHEKAGPSAGTGRCGCGSGTNQVSKGCAGATLLFLTCAARGPGRKRC